VVKAASLGGSVGAALTASRAHRILPDHTISRRPDCAFLAINQTVCAK
jgi:hypothetical protein